MLEADYSNGQSSEFSMLDVQNSPYQIYKWPMQQTANPKLLNG
jgi:hypothetical protein